MNELENIFDNLGLDTKEILEQLIQNGIFKF